MATQQVLVTKDMTIGEIVERFPHVAKTIESFGLHCIGCHVNPYESLEQGALGHGMTEDEVHKLIEAVNKAAGEKPSAEEHAGHTHNEHGSHSHNSASNGNAKVMLTKNAAAKFVDFRQKEGKTPEFGLRVMAAPGGCAGFMYRLEFDTKKENDTVFDEEGIKVLVSEEQLPMLKGTIIDYVDSLEGSGFKINNPNASASCGCGKSFS